MAIIGSIFDDLHDEELAQIISISQDANFTPGQIIFKQDEPGDCLYIIKEGLVEQSKLSDIGENMIIGQVQAGAFLGELSVLDGGKRPVTATAVESTSTFMITKKNLDALQAQYPPIVIKFYLAIIRDINERLRVVNESYVSAKQNLF